MDIGANASAEGEDAEALEDAEEQVIDVVDSFRLQSIPFGDKKTFAGQLKGMSPRYRYQFRMYADEGPGFLKKVKAKWEEAGKSEEEIKNYQQGIQSYFTKKLAPNFKDLDFYSGENMDPDGM